MTHSEIARPAPRDSGACGSILTRLPHPDEGSAPIPSAPEPCLKGRCRSPVACNGFGYCRERNMGESRPYDAALNSLGSFNLAIRSLRLEHVSQGLSEPRTAQERVVAGLGLTAGEIVRAGFLR